MLALSQSYANLNKKHLILIAWIIWLFIILIKILLLKRVFLYFVVVRLKLTNYFYIFTQITNHLNIKNRTRI